MKDTLSTTFGFDWKWTGGAVTARFGNHLFRMCGFRPNGTKAIAPVLSFLFPMGALGRLCSEAIGEMYYFSLAVEGIAIIGNLDLQGLNIVVLVVVVNVSCDYRLDILDDLLMPGFMDDGYVYSARGWEERVGYGIVRFARCV